MKQLPIDLSPGQLEWMASRRLAVGDVADWQPLRLRLDGVAIRRTWLERFGARPQPVPCELSATVWRPDGTSHPASFGRCMHPTSFPLRIGPYYQPHGLFDRRRGWVLEIVDAARDGGFVEARGGTVDDPPSIHVTGDPAGLDREMRQLIAWSEDASFDPEAAVAPPGGSVFSVSVPTLSLSSAGPRLTFHRTRDGLFVEISTGCIASVIRWYGPYVADGARFIRR